MKYREYPLHCIYNIRKMIKEKRLYMCTFIGMYNGERVIIGSYPNVESAQKTLDIAIKKGVTDIEEITYYHLCRQN